MKTISIDPTTHDRLNLVAKALGKTESETISFLLDRFVQISPPPSVSSGPAHGTAVPIHVLYKGERVDAIYDRQTKKVTIETGPLTGTSYEKPSPAARAVVGSIDSNVNPHRNGWSFWLVTETGKPLQSVRGNP